MWITHYDLPLSCNDLGQLHNSVEHWFLINICTPKTQAYKFLIFWQCYIYNTTIWAQEYLITNQNHLRHHASSSTSKGIIYQCLKLKKKTIWHLNLKLKPQNCFFIPSPAMNLQLLPYKSQISFSSSLKMAAIHWGLMQFWSLWKGDCTWYFLKTSRNPHGVDTIWNFIIWNIRKLMAFRP